MAASVRRPAVAGSFYPASPDDVGRTVAQLFDGIAPEPSFWRAALVPHAGWMYSGRLAAQVFAHAIVPDSVVVLCPRHHAVGVKWAVAPHDVWTWPGGKLASDHELANLICSSIDGVEYDASSHEREHAIEVQLPLLARRNASTHVVGITVGPTDLEECGVFATGLATALSSYPHSVLLLISSDMNHFASDVENRRLDKMAIHHLKEMQPEELFETCRVNGISMCGVGPAVIALKTLQHLGELRESKLVDYHTSGDISGDRTRVVGYAGMLFR